MPLPGVIRLVKHLHAHGIPIAVATSSRRETFKLKTMNLGYLFSYFEGRVICSDDGLFDKSRGKPCPDIFLVTANRTLGRSAGSSEVEEASSEEKLERSKALVFEDAIPGIEASKRAGMNGKKCFFNRVTCFADVCSSQLFGWRMRICSKLDSQQHTKPTRF